MAGADVNAFQILDFRAAALIAERIGESADAPPSGKKPASRRSVNAHLWIQTPNRTSPTIPWRKSAFPA
jgi:hypothetical protein